MSDCSEAFRTEIVSKLLSTVPQDQIRSILSAIDSVLPDYDISHRTVSLITRDEIPQIVKFFIATKSVKNLSRKTLNLYKLRLMDFFSKVNKSYDEITTTDIRMYVYYYKETRHTSDCYCENIRRILHSFFSWCVDNDYLTRNPCSNVENIKYQEKQRQPLSPYELECLRWNCKDIREKAMVDFFFSTGVRLSECHDANISDINWSQRSVIIRHGKGNKRRIVYFNAEAELTLRKYLESRTDNNDALFVTLRNPHRRLCYKAIEDVITKVANRAGLHVYPHLLRHTFATTGIHGGISIEKLQALMGHAEPKTTLIYAKLDNCDLQHEHQRIYT